MNANQFELVIIGAGPAGMSAASTAAKQGLKVLLIDEQKRPGGQIYRNISSPVLKDKQILGRDYYYGEKLLTAFEGAGVTYLSGATVWEVTADNVLYVSVNGESQRFEFNKLLIATGAQERPAPFPGWTLPGVMTCGAAQILLKTSGLTPPGPVVVAGSGPLLLLIACQLIRAGIKIEAILDTTPAKNYRSALPEFLGALKGWRFLLKGVRMLAELRKAGIRQLSGVSGLSANQDESGTLSTVTYFHKGRQQTISCSSLLVHQGVIPSTQLTRSLGLAHVWDEVQKCWKPELNKRGQSSHPDILVAGDSAGIGGALAAELQGKLAVFEVVRQLNASAAGNNAIEQEKAIRELQQQLVIRPFLDRLYSPADEFLLPPDETIVCRCEEVTAGEIRSLANQGCSGPNQTKAFCRAGMGPCQGRQCGTSVSALLADELQATPGQVGYYNIRPPIKPLTLGELAAIGNTDSNS
ncbi:MAG: FAD/NAD(P)-binding oxidoreductase [Amphritea sp.]